MFGLFAKETKTDNLKQIIFGLFANAVLKAHIQR